MTRNLRVPAEGQHAGVLPAAPDGIRAGAGPAPVDADPALAGQRLNSLHPRARAAEMRRLQRSYGNRWVQGALARALPDQTRTRMETAFGADFSDVAVREGPEPASLGAAALTTGSDVIFDAGIYDPHSPEGLHVLGHELAHVLQQRAGRVPAHAPVNEDPALEAEADDAGRRAAQGQIVNIASGQQSAPVAPAVAQPAKLFKKLGKLIRGRPSAPSPATFPTPASAPQPVTRTSSFELADRLENDPERSMELKKAAHAAKRNFLVAVKEWEDFRKQTADLHHATYRPYQWGTFLPGQDPGAAATGTPTDADVPDGGTADPGGSDYYPPDYYPPIGGRGEENLYAPSREPESENLQDQPPALRGGRPPTVGRPISAADQRLDETLQWASATVAEALKSERGDEWVDRLVFITPDDLPVATRSEKLAFVQMQFEADLRELIEKTNPQLDELERARTELVMALEVQIERLVYGNPAVIHRWRRNRPGGWS